MVDGRTGKLLFPDAAGTYSPRRREADPADLSKLVGVQVEGGPAQRGSRTGNPGHTPVLVALSQWVRNHYLWPRYLAHSHVALHVARRIADPGKAGWRRHRFSCLVAQPCGSLSGERSHQHRVPAGHRGGAAARLVV